VIALRDWPSGTRRSSCKQIFLLFLGMVAATLMVWSLQTLSKHKKEDCIGALEKIVRGSWAHPPGEGEEQL
jgi:hypothetical protein